MKTKKGPQRFHHSNKNWRGRRSVDPYRLTASEARLGRKACHAQALTLAHQQSHALRSSCGEGSESTLQDVHQNEFLTLLALMHGDRAT